MRKRSNWASEKRIEIDVMIQKLQENANLWIVRRWNEPLWNSPKYTATFCFPSKCTLFAIAKWSFQCDNDVWSNSCTNLHRTWLHRLLVISMWWFDQDSKMQIIAAAKWCTTKWNCAIKRYSNFRAPEKTKDENFNHICSQIDVCNTKDTDGLDLK